MKRRSQTQFYDKLHRGSVLACVGLTIYGAVLLSERFYKFYTQSRPKIQAAKAAAEEELLSEGSSEKLVL